MAMKQFKALDLITKPNSSAFRRPRHGTSIPTMSRRLYSTTASRSFKIPGQSIILSSGRTLGYHTSGPSNGTPIIYIHGHPDSGLTITGALESRVADELNIRWIGPDRPGVGLSTAYDEQEVLDYPSDIQSLIRHLELKEYYILGTSGGTGFTLACANALPRDELRGVGICAGIGPVEAGFESMSDHNLKALEAWRNYPKEFRDYFEKEYMPLAQQSDPTSLAARLRSDFEGAFTGEDLGALLEPQAFEIAVNVFRQVWCQGAWAHAKGMEIHWKPWGFRLEDVAFPGIKLWYGEQDVNTTPAMGIYMAERLKDSVYREYPGASHITLWREGVLQQLVGGLIGRGSFSI